MSAIGQMNRYTTERLNSFLGWLRLPYDHLVQVTTEESHFRGQASYYILMKDYEDKTIDFLGITDEFFTVIHVLYM